MDKAERKRIKKERKRQKISESAAASTTTEQHVARPPLVPNKRRHAEEEVKEAALSEHVDAEAAQRERKRQKKEKKAAKKAARAALAALDAHDAAAVDAEAQAITSGDQGAAHQELPAPPTGDDVVLTEEDLLRILSTAPIDNNNNAGPSNAMHAIDPQLQSLPGPSKVANGKSKGKKSKAKRQADIPVQAPTTSQLGSGGVDEPHSAPGPSIIQQSGPRRERRRGVTTDTTHMTTEEILTTNWFDLKTINALALERGFEVKRGVYSPEEDAAIEQALVSWGQLRNLTRDDIVHKIIHPPRGTARIKTAELAADTVGFWTHLAKSVPGRPQRSVHRHVQSVYSPVRRQGVWKPEEIDTLETGYAQYGNAWTKISDMIGRSALDVRTKWREMHPEISKKFPRRRGKNIRKKKEYPSEALVVDSSSASSSDGGDELDSD